MVDHTNEGEDLQRAVLEAVGVAEGADPADLPYSVYDWIDLELLTRLFEGSPGIIRVTFEVKGHEFTVAAAGTITIDGTAYQVDQLLNR